MRRISLILLVAVAAGCGEPSQPPVEVKAPITVANQPAKQALPPPNFDPNSRLALVRRTGEIRLGMAYEDALAVIAQPPGSYDKSDLPPSITDPYEARGWQTKNEGFGTILYRGRVAAAMYQLSNASEDRVQEAVQEEQDRLGAPLSTINGKHVRYWFWQSGTREQRGDQLVMICATEVVPNKMQLAIALGTLPVMQALGMTPDTASGDQINADRMIDRLRATKKQG